MTLTIENQAEAATVADLRKALRDVMEIVEARNSQGGQLSLNEEGQRRMTRARDLLDVPGRSDSERSAHDQPWKEAVLDQLAITCTDAPIGTPPKDILEQVIAWHIDVERYFAAQSLGILTGAAAAAQQTSALAWLYETPLPDGTIFTGASTERLTVGIGAPSGSVETPLGRLARGLPALQEPKYTTDGCQIVNRATGIAIPADEPVFIFRARDQHAREALEAYACVLVPGDHRDAVVERIADFARFSQAQPSRIKEPDTEKAGCA